MSDDEDEALTDEDKDRIERVKGKRRQRDRQRSRSRTQEEQAPQEQRAPQAEQGQQENRDGNDNQQTRAPQAQQEPMDSQATEAAGEAQAPRAAQEQLEPVTQREHDTFYLSEDVRDELNQIYRRVALDVLEETGVDIDDQQVGGRNRYFRPLALLLGARELRGMTPDELRETIEDEDLVDDLPDE